MTSPPAAGRLRALLPWGAVALAGVFALRRLGDFDTWWHLAAGRWIATHHRVMWTDTLSFTVPGHEWLDLQWLYDLASWGLFQAGGPTALVLAGTAAYAAAVALMVRGVARSLGPLATTVLAVWVTVVAEERFVVRPEMLTLVLLQVVLGLLATAREDEGRRLWLLVPVMLLWANVHALFAVGLYCIAAATAAALVAERVPLPAAWREATVLPPAARRRLLVAAALSAAAVLANPYHVHGVIFPLELLRRFGPDSPFRVIGEFQNPFTSWDITFTMRAYRALLGFALVVVALAGLVTAFPGRRREPRSGRPPGFDLGGLAIFAGLAYLSVQARRNAALFALGSAPFLATCLAAAGARLAFAPRPRAKTATRALSVAAAGALAAALGFVASNGWYRWDSQSHAFGLGVLRAHSLAEAAAFVREIGLRGRLYNDLAAGGYLAWARPTDEGVYVDGRLEVYDEAFFADYLETLRGGERFAARVEEFGITGVVLQHRLEGRHALAARLARDPAWTLLYHDQAGIVFARTAGNEAVIARAREAFPARHARTMAWLLGAPPRVGWDVDRLLSAFTYAALLHTLGEEDEAVALDRAALALDPATIDTATLHLRLADHHLRRGDRTAAVLELERAAAAAPGIPAIQEALARLRP